VLDGFSAVLAAILGANLYHLGPPARNSASLDRERKVIGFSKGIGGREETLLCDKEYVYVSQNSTT
jgi:hypothetical protein